MLVIASDVHKPCTTDQFDKNSKRKHFEAKCLRFIVIHVNHIT